MTRACSRRDRQDALPIDLESFLELTEPETLPHSGADRLAAAETSSAASGWQILRLSDVTPLSTGWLCPGLLPRGRLTVLAGESGTGKSYLAADLAARFSTFPRPGTPAERPASGDSDAPDQPHNGHPPHADDRPPRVFWAAGDDPADLLYARLTVLGADLTQIAAVTPPADDSSVAGVTAGSTVADAVGDSSLAGAALLPVAPAVLRDVVEQSPRADLLVIDGLRADPLDQAVQQELAAVLAELAQLAASADVAVLLIWRSEPGRRGRRAVAALAEPACVAALWQLDRHPADPDLRRLAAVKWNLAADPRPLGFRLPGGRLEWQLLPSDPRFATGSERQTAAAWLRQRLAAGPVPVRDLQAEARDCGFSLRTLRRAREDLGLEAVHQSDGETVCWHWRLPEQVLLPSPFPPNWEPEAYEQDELTIDEPAPSPDDQAEVGNPASEASEACTLASEGCDPFAPPRAANSPHENKAPLRNGKSRKSAKKRRARRLLTNWAK